MIAWFKWHHMILDLFLDEPSRLLVVDIDDSEMYSKISHFLGKPYLEHSDVHNKTTVKHEIIHHTWFNYKSKD